MYLILYDDNDNTRSSQVHILYVLYSQDAKKICEFNQQSSFLYLLFRIKIVNNLKILSGSLRFEYIQIKYIVLWALISTLKICNEYRLGHKLGQTNVLSTYRYILTVLETFSLQWFILTQITYVKWGIYSICITYVKELVPDISSVFDFRYQ